MTTKVVAKKGESQSDSERVTLTEMRGCTNKSKRYWGSCEDMLNQEDTINIDASATVKFFQIKIVSHNKEVNS